MILAITISGEIRNIETNQFLYGYNNAGLEIIPDKNYKSAAAAYFENNTPGILTLPAYIDFVTDTAMAKFVEITHATHGNICINTTKIQKLEEIDANNTTIWFDQFTSVDTDTALADLKAIINSALNGTQDADEDIVSDGSGIITLSNNYISGSWTVKLRGVEVRRTDVSETGANELTLTGVTTEVGDIINVKYKY